MNYDVNGKAEAAWIAVGTAAGSLVGAVLVAFDVDVGIVGAVSALTVGLVRLIVGHFLPSTE